MKWCTTSGMRWIDRRTQLKAPIPSSGLEVLSDPLCGATGAHTRVAKGVLHRYLLCLVLQGI